MATTVIVKYVLQYGIMVTSLPRVGQFVIARWSIRNHWKNNLVTLLCWFKSSILVYPTVEVLQRKPFAFELFFLLGHAQGGSSHLAQKHVAWFRHQTYVGTFRSRKISLLLLVRLSDQSSSSDEVGGLLQVLQAPI